MHARTVRVFLTAAFATVLLVFMSLPAMAEPVTYTLNTANTSSLPAPYANVTLELTNNSKAIQVTVQTLGNYVLWGGSKVFGFNYAGSDNLFLSGGSGLSLITSRSSMSDFGKFDYYVDSSKKNQALGNTLSFTVSRRNGQTFSDLTALADENSKNNLFALHLKSTSLGLTGYAGGGTPQAPPTPTPEPGSLALLGAGLIMVGGVVRRYRR